MSEEAWKPPTGRMGGAVIFHDWQPIRKAIEAAYEALGQEIGGDIPEADWNLAGLAIDAYRHETRAKCIDCRSPLWPSQTIRCLDCKAPLCERCAPRHFWPNGRPGGSHR